MQLIPVKPSIHPAHPLESAHEALAGVISSIGKANFGYEALAQLNRWMPLCWLSVYTLYPHRQPRLETVGCYQSDDGTYTSWIAYIKHLYQQDQTFHQAREYIQSHGLSVMHWVDKEIPVIHRSQIYERYGLKERLSIVSSAEDQGLLAINFYRHRNQPGFSDECIDAMRAVAPSILACIQSNIHLQAQSQPARSGPPAFLATLPPREREVCERLLQGWTQDGIAADLGVSVSTVKTYRNRAFQRLGINSRHALAALVG